MYTKYFGLDEKPFTLTPNPRFIFLSKHHKEAFAHLLYGINNHYGFIELVGEVGTGKTTVLRTLLNQLNEENYRTALIVNPCLTGVELLRSICHEFGLDSKSEFANELLNELNRFLLHETAEGRTVVLVIDEAQNLQPEVLEQIRLISNLETENDKLIQIILAGQPELGVLLERPELRQLNQRIAVRYSLKSMSFPETKAYIRHRMEVAGDTGGVSFTLIAVRWIYLYTRGVPRMINILCDRALLVAYGIERRRITAGIITMAIREILNVPQGKKLTRAFALLMAVAVILITLSLILTGHSAKKNSTPLQTNATTSKADSVSAAQKGADNNTSGISQEIFAINQNEAHLLAFNAIAERWGLRPARHPGVNITVPETFSLLAAKKQLRVTAFKGTLDEALRFGIPLLTLTRINGEFGGYCVAVTAATNDSVSISPPISNRSTIKKEELNSISSGTYYLVWQNSGQIPVSLKEGDNRYEIRMLQLFLQRAGTYNDLIDGIYGSITVKAVRDFQRSFGLPLDDSVGELTLAALAKYYIASKAPSAPAAGSSR